MHSVWMIVILAVWSSVCNVWTYLLWLQWHARRHGWLLPEAASQLGTSVESPQSVRIIVPVRNVGEGVQPCLRSILAQASDHWRLTIVDDRSEDDTAEQVRRHVGNDDRVQIITIAQLPAGWLGKSHALWTAAAHATEDWLLFIDDDCILEPHAVNTAVAYTQEQHADLLTLWPRHLAASFWEHMVVPLCGGIIALWFGSPNVNKDAGAVAFGNGQFMLIRREAYQRIGGHRSVRDAIIEDVPLAERAKREGLRCRVASGANLFGVRMYRSYRAVIDGWARIFVGALRSGPKLIASMLWLCFGNLWPFLALPVCIAMAVQSAGSQGWFWLAAIALGAAHVLLIVLVSYRFWGLGRCDRRYLWLYPLSVVIVLRILAAAWYQLAIRRRVSWRNTAYKIDGEGRILSA